MPRKPTLKHTVIGDGGGDTLAEWVRFIRWTEENVINDHSSDRLRFLLEQCIEDLRYRQEYLQDPRFLEIFQKYASLSKHLGAVKIYERLAHQRMFTTLSQFYVTWALELEARRQLADAACVFYLGGRANAQPAELLRRSYAEFLARNNNSEEHTGVFLSSLLPESPWCERDRDRAQREFVFGESCASTHAASLRSEVEKLLPLIPPRFNNKLEQPEPEGSEQATSFSTSFTTYDMRKALAAYEDTLQFSRWLNNGAGPTSNEVVVKMAEAENHGHSTVCYPAANTGSAAPKTNAATVVKRFVDQLRHDDNGNCVTTNSAVFAKSSEHCQRPVKNREPQPPPPIVDDPHPSAAAAVADVPVAPPPDPSASHLTIGEATFARALTAARKMRCISTPISRSNAASAAPASEGENLNSARHGVQTAITSSVNPWDSQLIEKLLQQTNAFTDADAHVDHRPSCPLPEITVNRCCTFGKMKYIIEQMIGTGTFTNVYSAMVLRTGETVALKVQKPACPWEKYMSDTIFRRVTCMNLGLVQNGFSWIREAHVFADGSVMIFEHFQNRSLAHVVDGYREANVTLHEPVAVYFVLEMLKLMHALRAVNVIHADIRPDNFVVVRPPPFFSEVDVRQVDFAALPVLCIKLVDFGRSVDMSLLPSGCTFTGVMEGSNFVCCEMQDGRPWTFQMDYFGLLCTIAFMIRGKYMVAFQHEKKWHCTAGISRTWDLRIWNRLFDSLLNIPGCDHLPDFNGFIDDFSNRLKKLIRFEFEHWRSEVEKLETILGTHAQDH